MQALTTLTLLSLIAMLVVTTTLGGRLLGMARRTRQLPELLFGFGFLGAGIGVGVGQLGASYLWTAPGTLATVMSTTLFGLVVAAVVALYTAIWRVFRPGDIYGLLSFGIGVGLAILAYGMRIGRGDFSARVLDGPGMSVFFVSVISVFTWAAIEAIHLHFRLGKQIRLGLSDPDTANQIGLWGVAASMSALMTLIIGHNLLTLDRSPLDDPLTTVLLLVTVLGGSGAMWCAFFPPAVLRSRLASE